MKRIVSALIILFAIGACFTACTEAERVNYNISKKSQYFDCERRVTVYNARTDKVILYIEGYIDISNDKEHAN